MRTVVFGAGLLTISTLAVAGCRPPATPRPAQEAPPELGRRFDAARTGAIRGQVVWEGSLPTATPLTVNLPGSRAKTEANPHAPQIDAATRAVRGAVVSLRRVDLDRARPWDHAPVRVVLAEHKINVYQGEVRGLVGIVRTLSAVDWSSEHTEFTSLRARGAEFFTLPFVEPRPTRRVHAAEGHVEVSCASGIFWARGHLVVSSHPYHCLTDADGRFVLDQVPDGTYEIECWLPNWEIDRIDVDPELRQPMRLHFQPPWRTGRTIRVQPAETAACALVLGK